MTKKTSRAEVINILQSQLADLKSRYGVEKIALFGSYSRDTASQESDVDILVHLSRPLGLEFISLATYLEEKLGKTVDLVTYDSLERNANHPRRGRISNEVKRTLVYVS